MFIYYGLVFKINVYLEITKNNFLSKFLNFYIYKWYTCRNNIILA